MYSVQCTSFKTLSNQTINQSRFVEAIFKNTVDWSCNMTMYCVNTMYASPLKKKRKTWALNYGDPKVIVLTLIIKLFKHCKSRSLFWMQFSKIKVQKDWAFDYQKYKKEQKNKSYLFMTFHFPLITWWLSFTNYMLKPLL